METLIETFWVEIDYPERLCFFEHSGKEQANDFDTVGLVLDTDSSGQLVVRAVSSTASAVTRQNILPGDIILQIVGSGGAPYTLTKAAQALSGVIGERKHLRILRRGEPMSVPVVVSRIL
jgi:C-terminal processing protease CtpA/Prc